MEKNFINTDEAADHIEDVSNPLYNSMAQNISADQFNETDVYIDWETKTKHTMGIDDDGMPHLLTSEPVDLLDKTKKSISDIGERQMESSLQQAEATMSMVKGVKKFFVRSKKDNWMLIKRAATKVNISAINALDLMSNGAYSNMVESVAGETYYRNNEKNMTITLRENSDDPEYSPGGQFSPFDINGTLKEGWQEISLPMKRLYDTDMQFKDESFGMPVLAEYAVQYGVPGVSMYKMLGAVPWINTWGRIILAELGTEFAGATRHEHDTNLANALEAFGYSKENSNKLRVAIVESLAANDDDTVFERKVKNAFGNAPLAVGFQGVLQVFKLMKGLKYNKEGRKLLSEELELKISNDAGAEGTFKILDADNNPIASFATKEEADAFQEALGEGYKVQEFKTPSQLFEYGILMRDAPQIKTGSQLFDFLHTLDLDDGFSLTIDGKTPLDLGFTSGFMVAPLKKTEIIKSKKDFTIEDGKEMIKNVENLEKALGGKYNEVYAGGWLNPEDNKFYLDASIRLDDLNDALYIAEAGEQIAIFDIKNGKSITVKEAIEQRKQTGSYSSGKELEQRGETEALGQRFEAEGLEAGQKVSLKKSEEPFRSNLVNAIKNIIIPERGIDPEQFYNTIKNTPGVKESEIKDTGFLDFILKNSEQKNQKITKAQIDEFLEQKDLTKNIKTTILEQGQFEKFKSQHPEFADAVDYDDLIDIVDEEHFVDASGSFGKWLDANKDLEIVKLRDKHLKEIGAESKDLGITGDIAAGEVSLFLRGAYESNKFDVIKKYLKDLGITPDSVTGSQTKFSAKEYSLPGGEDYKEMIISNKGTTDVYQKGHFVDVAPKGENVMAHVRFNTRTINGKKTLFIEELQSDLHQKGKKSGYKKEGFYDTEKPPDEPFKKNWHEMAMKRIIKYAIDNGFDAISWTPGKVQAARYDLSKQIEKISIKLNNDGTVHLKANAKRSIHEINKNIKVEQLEDYVGKDLAETITNDLEKIKIPEGERIKTNKKIKNLEKEYKNVSQKMDILNEGGVNVNKKHYPRATRNYYFKYEGAGLRVYYSYTTPIAYELNGKMVMRVNDWSTTTNKHMSWTGVPADDRIPGWKFEEKLKEVKYSNEIIVDFDEFDELAKKQSKIEKQLKLLKESNINVYKGLDLQVGGEGMKGFYDQIMSSFLKKFSKKYNAQLKTGSLEGVPKKLKLGLSDISSNEVYVPKAGTELILVRVPSSAYSRGRFVLKQNDKIILRTDSFHDGKKELLNIYNKLVGEAGMEVPLLEFTPEMIKDILETGVPIASKKERKTAATAMA